MTHSAGKVSNRLLSFIAFLVMLAALVFAFLSGWERADRKFLSAFENAAQKGRLAAAMQVNLLSSATAEKSAVLAPTDEASKTLADESRRATAAVEADRSALAGLIETGGRPDQVEQLADFNECWVRFQEIDREVLGLAVENTNLKAQQLSFAPATEALERMQSAFEQFVNQASSDVILRSAYRAMTAALRIHALEGRHIAEASDEEMDKIEGRMKTLDAQVVEAFTALTASADDLIRPSVEAARNAYADFQKANDEVLSLSRRNSNLRSMAISLGQKRKVTAECQDRLTSVQESLRQELSGPTR